MSDDAELDYAWLTQDALRGVVRSVLETTVALGMPPGEHHFYIEFLTTAPGVQVSDRLRAQYPERMTIVLQHQFEALEVDAEGFAVTLHFGGVADRLIVPFAAVTQFADPSASFALQFAPVMDDAADEGADTQAQGSDAAEGGADIEPLRPAGRTEDAGAKSTRSKGTGEPDGDDEPDPPTGGPSGGSPGGDGGADVVSLDRFRRK